MNISEKWKTFISGIRSVRDLQSAVTLSAMLQSPEVAQRPKAKQTVSIRPNTVTI